MKTSTDFQEAGDTPANRNSPSRRLRDSTKNFKKCALARAIPANNSENISFLNPEAHVLQRPELLEFVTLYDLPAMSKVDVCGHYFIAVSAYRQRKKRYLRVCPMSKPNAPREVFD